MEINFQKNLNYQKIFAVIISAFVLVSAANYFAFAWTEPTSFPTSGNILAPINTGSSAQTKAGGLTVSSLTTFGASPQIDLLGGIIHRANYLIGHNDLQLYSDDTAQAEIDLSKGGFGKIEFYTSSQERMRIENNGDIYIDGLSDCFLDVDGDGKIRCYEPSGPPINKTFTSEKSTIFEITRSSTGTTEDVHTVAEDEVVTKISMNAISVYKSTESFNCGVGGVYVKFYFYIKETGETEWGDARESFNFSPYCYVHNSGSKTYCRCQAGSKSAEWYYHLKQGDEMKAIIEVKEGDAWGTYANLTGLSMLENLTFNREITEYVSCEEGKDILYYLDKNVTGEMWKVRERYQPEGPLLMSATADGISIDLVISSP